MRTSRWLTTALFAALAMLACRDLNLISPPANPKPGSISGRVVVAEPGRPGTHPIEGVQVEVLGTGLITTTDPLGYFRIEGITSDAAQVLFRFDLDHDGHPDRQKLLSLQALKAGVGRDVAIGDVLLASNATLKGKVLRDDVSGASGHAGTLIFVPVGPYQTSTGDDGSFLLSDLPEGTLSIAFFRPGYAPFSFDSVSLSGGEEVTLRTVRLTVATTMPDPAMVVGRVRLSDGKPGDGARVLLTGLAGAPAETTALGDGSFTFTNVSSGVYSISASRSGAYDGQLLNILISGGTVNLPDVVLGLIPTMGTGGGSGGSGGSAGGGFTNAGGFAPAGGTGGDAGGTAGSATGGGTAGGTGVGGGTAGGTGVGGGAGVGGGTGGAAGGAVTVPATPQNLQAAPGNAKLTLTWSPSSGATSYTLYYSQQPAVTKANGTRLANATSPFAHQGLTNGTPYYYVVTASNSAGESADSPVANGIPAVPSAAALRVVLSRPEEQDRGVAHDAPLVIRLNKAIDGASATASTVTLTGPAGAAVAATRSVANNTITLTPSAPLAPETQYTLALTTGVKDTGGQALSAAYSAQFTTASPRPTNLRVVPGNSAATLLWDPVPGATQYVVARATSPGGAPTVFYTAIGSSYLDAAAGNGTPYFYRVSAYTPFGTTPASSEVTVNASPSKPTGPNGVKARAGKSAALVEWDPVASATGYTLYRGSRSMGPLTVVATGLSTTVYLDTGLAPGTWYYVVQAESLMGPSVYSREAAAVVDGALAAAPANLSVSRGYGWLRLTWNAVASAQGYVVLRLDAPLSDTAQVAWVTQGTSYDSLSLSNGTTYRHFVAAVVNGRIGDFADVASAPGPQFAPAPPVLAQPLAYVNRIDLSWNTPAGATLVTLLRSTTPGGPYSAVGVSASDTSVTAPTRYYYVVRADNGSALGGFSNEVSMVPLAAGTPGVPQNLSVEAANGAAQVSWSPVNDVAQYEVGYALTPNSGAYTLGCSANQPFETRCTVGLTNETTYYLAVRSWNGAGYGPYSSEVTVTPTALGATAGLPAPSPSLLGGNGVVTLYWSAVVGATSYKVWRRTYSSDWVSLGAPTTSTLWNDSTASNGTAYKYAVQALNSSGPRISPWGVTAYVTPTVRLPVRPSGFTIEAVKSGFMASWAPVPGATGYTVRGGYYGGASISAPQISCNTSGAYETRCLVGGTNGTAYFLSVSSYSPEGQSAVTDELMSTADPLAPVAPTPGYNYGNGTVSAFAAAVSGATSYRFYTRARYADWQLAATLPIPLFTLAQPNGVEVQLAMRAVGSNGVVGEWSMGSLMAPQFDRPPNVTGVTATPANGGVLVSYDPVPGSNGYYINTCDVPGGPLATRGQQTDPFDTRTLISTSNGTSQAATVVAFNVNQAGDFSTSGQPTATASGALPATPSVTLVPGNEAMSIFWPAVSGATAYRVWRRMPGFDWRLFTTLTSTSFTDYDVQNGESVRYAVQPVSGAGAGGWGFTNMTPASAALPRAPEDVKVSAGNATVQVEWGVVAGATSYQVYTAANQLGPYAYYSTVYGLYENRMRVAATNGQLLWAVVSANNAVGTGVASLEASATASASLPGLPSGPNVTAGSAGQLQVTWGAVSGATLYRVYRRSDTVPTALVSMTSMTSVLDTGLTSGTTYTYYVEAESGAGRSSWAGPTPAVAP
ncbi:MAG: Ig-like domain-containing protein [Archangiaceae bacterium]|nr:Ig-like domain-containing protein [Archangiaceae bacterium]